MKSESRMKKKKHRVSEEPASYQNGEIVLYQTPDGTRHIADNALVAITLMIAESDPK